MKLYSNNRMEEHGDNYDNPENEKNKFFATFYPILKYILFVMVLDLETPYFTRNLLD